MGPFLCLAAFLAWLSPIDGNEGPAVIDQAVAAEAVTVSATLRTAIPEAVLKAFDPDISVEAVFALQSENSAFGGLSGLWIAPDGRRMVAVSDVGDLWQARMVHDDGGRLVDLKGWAVTDLRTRPEEGQGRRWYDAESLTSLGSDHLVVGYEGHHRLRSWQLDDFEAVPGRMPLPQGLGGPSNSGIEALATLDDGRLFAVAERVGAWGGEGLMGWVIDDRAAEDLIYMPGPDFAPTGAGRLDDMMFVIERSFSLFGGFRSRLVTFPTSVVTPGARIEGRELAAFRWGDLGENFEAVAARRGSDGRVLLYLLADDNFSFLQTTLLVQLSLSAELLTN